MKYDYKAVEAKWQKVWEDEKTFHVDTTRISVPSSMSSSCPTNPI